MASGIAIVATAMPGTSLYDEVDGCGLIVPPGDVVKFSSAIERLLDEQTLRLALGAKARERALVRWNKDIILSDFLNLLTGDDAKAQTYANVPRHLGGTVPYDKVTKS
jgi:colanic acid biosynthesis glycosyl transferase WcaI